MSDPVSIELKEPVEVGGLCIDKLSMRGPKVRDLLAAEKAGKGDAEREIRLFSLLCEVSPKAIEELSLADYGKLQQAYQGFLS